MLHSARASRGMVTAPHQLAAQAGLAVLRDGGNAIEAMIAAAAAIAVVYPHMNGIGGDGFWLIHLPDRAPVSICACGGAGSQITPDLYRRRGLRAIPARGADAMITVAGTVGGWQQARAISAAIGGRLPLERLLADAIDYAANGFPVSAGQAALTAEKCDELKDVPGFAASFLPAGTPPAGALFRQPRLAETLRQLAAEGLDGFYRGRLAQRIAADLVRAGAKLTADDLAGYAARQETPLRLRLPCGEIFNLRPPTQGLASLMILGIFDRLGVTEAEGFDHLHGLVEATKQAFILRNRELADPRVMRIVPDNLLADDQLAALAARIDRRRALPWPEPAAEGDTVWLGAIDRNGVAVSFIQSLYWEFGSGVVLDETGILWQNRGCSFVLEPGHLNCLAPGKLPFHTLNPALAALGDGRIMVYGTMGGEGQPQTQAAIFSRHVLFGQDLQASVTAPRWLLGRTWGAESTSLKLEARFSRELVEALRQAGHAVEVIPAFSDLVGHAGAVVRHKTGTLEGAADPRSDGAAVGF